MAQLRTSVGQLLVNEALPEELRDYSRSLDKKELSNLLGRVAKEHPERYREISHALSKIGSAVSYRTGGFSVGLKHLRPAKAMLAMRQKLLQDIAKLENNDSLDDDERERQLLLLIGRASAGLPKAIYEESLAEHNPLAYQVLSGARGNPMNLASLRGADMLYTDHRNRVLPLPVLHSYSEGLTPAEYWAASYGARKGVMDTKFCVFAKEPVLMADYSEKAIEDVKPGDWVMGADGQGRLLPVRVRQVWNNGRRPCYRYRFRKGSCRNEDSFRELIATEEHRVLAQIKAGQPGSTYAKHSVYTPTPLPLAKATCRKDPTKNWFVAWPARGEQGCLDRVDEPRALLAGLMLGDGCMAPCAKGRYSLSCGDPKLLDDVAPYLQKFNLRLSRSCETQYGYNLVEIKRSKRQTRVVAGRNEFAPGHLNQTKSWLKYVLGEKLAHEKLVPEDVWTWNDRSLGDFIGGIFATDGGVEARKDGCSITLTMTSCEVVTQVQRLLELRLGIWTSSLRHIPKEKLDNAVHDQYEITISHPECTRRFAERIRLIGCKRQELLTALMYRSQDPASRELGFKIHSKEFLGSLPTYDLEVEHPDHLYCLANGLIVSNSTQDAGFLSKQLNQIAHRAVVVGDDAEEESDTVRGLPVDVDDEDNEGALLAQPVAGYARNTVLTPKIMADIKRRNIRRVLVRSPITGGTPDGGVYARDVGVREFGRLPVAGENPGLTAAQALSEPLSQAQLSSKHSGGVANATAGAVSGFDLINQMVQVPKTFKGGAAHAERDGMVEHVEDAPAGGKFVQIDGQRHYVGSGFAVKVKRGDHVEAGDVISEGLPNPAIVTRHKGLGEAQRYYVQAFRQAFRDAGIRGHRRNIELLAKGLINHVRLTDEVGDYAPDDVVPYATLAASYRPREGFRALRPDQAVGQYLEKPYLHYTIGTKIRPSMLRDFQDFGVNEVVTHANPPPFEPEMVRAMSNLQHDPDWITRMYASGLQKSLLSATHRGAYSDETGTSFVPGLAKAINFGQVGKVITPKPPPRPGSPLASRETAQFKIGEQLTRHADAVKATLQKQANEAPLLTYEHMAALNRLRDEFRQDYAEARSSQDVPERYRHQFADPFPDAEVAPPQWSTADLPTWMQVAVNFGLSQALDKSLARVHPLATMFDVVTWGGQPEHRENKTFHNYLRGQQDSYTARQKENPLPAWPAQLESHPELGPYVKQYNAAVTAGKYPDVETAQQLFYNTPPALVQPEAGPRLRADFLQQFPEPQRQFLTQYEQLPATEQEQLRLAREQLTEPYFKATEDYYRARFGEMPAEAQQINRNLRNQFGAGYLWSPEDLQKKLQIAHGAKFDEQSWRRPWLQQQAYKDDLQQLTQTAAEPYNKLTTTYAQLGQPPAAPAAALAPQEQANSAPDYQPGFGLLPLAQVANQLNPQLTQQMLSAAGPFGLPALVDTNAVAALTQGPQRPVSPPTTPAQPPRPPRPSAIYNADVQKPRTPWRPPAAPASPPPRQPAQPAQAANWANANGLQPYRPTQAADWANANGFQPDTGFKPKPFKPRTPIAQPKSPVPGG